MYSMRTNIYSQLVKLSGLKDTYLYAHTNDFNAIEWREITLGKLDGSQPGELEICDMETEISIFSDHNVASNSILNSFVKVVKADFDVTSQFR
jgi:hypothetical protein